MLKDDSDSNPYNEHLATSFKLKVQDDSLAKLKEKLKSLAKSVPEGDRKKLSNDIFLEELPRTDEKSRQFRFACPVSGCCSFIEVSIENSECLNVSNFSLHLKNHLKTLTECETGKAKRESKERPKAVPDEKQKQETSEDTLGVYMNKCRCCLEGVKGDTYLKITKFIEERFFDFTLTAVRF